MISFMLLLISLYMHSSYTVYSSIFTCYTWYVENEDQMKSTLIYLTSAFNDSLIAGLSGASDPDRSDFFLWSSSRMLVSEPRVSCLAKDASETNDFSLSKVAGGPFAIGCKICADVALRCDCAVPCRSRCGGIFLGPEIR